MPSSGMAVEVTLAKWGDGTPNMNVVDTPPVTGAINVPQSPSGTSITNTNRTLSASQASFSKLVYTWNGARIPTNPV